MARRGWTPDQIDSAVKQGERIDEINKMTGGSATRYVNPTTGRSVVIDNITGEVIQVGGDGFKFGEASGDRPGAAMQPPPKPSIPSEIDGGGGGGGIEPFPKQSRKIPYQDEPRD